MAQMDKVTQQNAANAEESASASEELSAQAEQMNGIVGELMAMVGGINRSKSIGSASRATKSRKLSSSDNAFHQIAGDSSKSSKTAVKATAANVIPLDSNDDFSDFNA